MIVEATHGQNVLLLGTRLLGVRNVLDPKLHRLSCVTTFAGIQAMRAGADIQKELWLCKAHLDIGLPTFTNMIEAR